MIKPLRSKLMPREKSLPIVYSTLVFLLSACATAANGNPKDVKETKLHGVEQFANDPRLGEQVSRMCFVFCSRTIAFLRLCFRFYVS